MHSFTDLLLTNRSKSFHKMTVTVMKTTFEKLKLRVTYIRNWNEFCNEKFRTQLLFKLLLENFNNSSSGINKFLEIRVNTFDIFAPPSPQEKIYAGKQCAINEQNLGKCSQKIASPKKQEE